MMRLICNGVALDLTEGATMSFKKHNPLFAFDNLQCERTQSFDLPATPTNDRVLALSKLPAYEGVGMRQVYDAELQNGAVVKRGNLYVTAYKNGVYNAVFVTGQLIGLQRIKQAGKVADLVDFGDYVYTNNPVINPIKDANGSLSTFDLVKYERDRGGIVPSANVANIIYACASTLGVSVDLTGARNIRYVPDIVHGLKAQNVLFQSSINDTSQPKKYDPAHPLEPTARYNNIQCRKTPLCYTFNAHAGYESYIAGQGGLFLYNVSQFVPRNKIKITFPVNFSDDLFIVYFPESGDHVFLGDYSFTNSGSIVKSGTPLAGRTVEIDAGQPFLFVDCRDYIYERQGTNYTIGWRFGFGSETGLRYNYTLEIAAAADGLENAVVWLQDNLPDITLVELLQTLAAVSGRALYYDDNSGLSLDEVNVTQWPILELRNVERLDDVRRTFGDYGQRNVVEFDTASNVSQSSRIRLAYVVPNDNLREENVLQTIPFSEGAPGTAGVRVRNANQYEDADKYMLAECKATDTYMQRVSLPRIAGIERLCVASTSVEVRAHMTLAEFEGLQPKSAVLYAGTRYVWTEASWSDGVAVLRLSKF